MTAEELQILERIAAAVEETNQLIRGNMAAEKELAKRRACNRDNMRRARGSVVCTHNDVYTQEVVERNEEEKRDIPPIPPIERKEEEKKEGIYREGGEVKKETLAEARERVNAEGFPIFWEKYPGTRKTKKKDVWGRFHARLMETKDPDRLLEQMLSALERWKESRIWQDGEGKFIMHPATWINNFSWLEENIPPPMGEDSVAKAEKANAKQKPSFRRVNPEGPNPMGLRNFIGADDSIKEKIQQIEEAKK